MYEALRHQIASGALAPGAWLPSQTALAAEFGAVPPTIRHALTRLEAEGLVARARGRGTIVRVEAAGAAPAVLIVDDEAPVRALLRAYVARAGYRAIEAGGPGEGLAALDGDPGIALVLSDVRMPDTGAGIDFIRRVRRRWPELPLAAVTAYPDDLAALHRTPESPVLVVPKPVRLHQIEEALRLSIRAPTPLQALAGRRAARLRALHEAALAVGGPVPAAPGARAALLVEIRDRAVAAVGGCDGNLVLAEDPAWSDLVSGSESADGLITLGTYAGLHRRRHRAQGATKHVLSTGAPVCVPDVRAPSRFGTYAQVYPRLVERGVRAIALVPLRVDGRVLGVLSVNLAQPGGLSEEDQEALGLFAAHAAYALERLRRAEAERRFRGLIEHNADGIAMLNPDGTIQYANALHGRLLGGGDDAAGIARLFAVVLERPGASTTHEVQVRLSGGAQRWVEVTATNLLHEPSVRAIVVNSRDITERKALEAQIRAALVDVCRLCEVERQLRRDLAARVQAEMRAALAAQEAERRRLARELHDEVGQTLTRLKLSLALAGRALPAPIADGPAGSSLRDALVMVDELVARVRSLSLDLRPAALDLLGLLPSLLGFCERYTAQTGVRVAFRHRGLDRRFAPDVETAAYRIVQEALTNVARHAGVAEASVVVRAGEARVQIQVGDRGRGFDAAAALAAARTSGLVGMRERTQLLGGRFRIESRPGHGTQVTAEVPLSLGEAGAPLTPSPSPAAGEGKKGPRGGKRNGSADDDARAGG